MQCHALPIGDRIGHRQLGPVQAVEQFDDKRQALRIAALDQGQHKLAAGAADEEVAVLAAALNALNVDQPTDLKPVKKGIQLLATDRRKNRHASAHHSKIFHDGIRRPLGWSERT